MRPSYVLCVRLGYRGGSRETWCGRTPLLESTFLDPAHALLTVRNGGRQRICRECADAMKRTLDEGADTDLGPGEILRRALEEPTPHAK